MAMQSWHASVARESCRATFRLTVLDDTPLSSISLVKTDVQRPADTTKSRYTWKTSQKRPRGDA